MNQSALTDYSHYVNNAVDLNFNFMAESEQDIYRATSQYNRLYPQEEPEPTGKPGNAERNSHNCVWLRFREPGR